jgi:hypothetical protein
MCCFYVSEINLQAFQFNKRTLLISSVCDGANKEKGASAYFKDGVIEEETLPGKESILIVPT